MPGVRTDLESVAAHIREGASMAVLKLEKLQPQRSTTTEPRFI
jgi:hypothetical protein